MFSRHTLLKRTFKPALSYIKVDSAAHIHICCLKNIKLSSQTRHLKYINNCRAAVFGSTLQVRCESSNVLSGNQPPGESIAGLDPIPEPPTPITPDAISTVTSAVESFGQEPPFSSMGLGSWFPPGIVQNCLEFLHVDCGLPWWGAVACGTLCIRLLMFPVVVMAQRNLAKLSNNMQDMQLIQSKITDARQRGDKFEVARYSAELMKFMEDKGINPLKNMVPPFIQAPVFISVFMGLRAMVNIPVESLKTGGILWFVDLTVPDQFYCLPIITSATLLCTIKLGAEGTATVGPNMYIAKYALTAVPICVFPFIVGFPGLLLVYWTTSNFITLFQVGLLRVPAVRKAFKIPEKISVEPADLPMKDKGFVGNIKDAWANIKITSELQSRERVDKMAFLQAGRAPIKKTYKYDPTKVKPVIEAKKNS